MPQRGPSEKNKNAMVKPSAMGNLWDGRRRLFDCRVRDLGIPLREYENSGKPLGLKAEALVILQYRIFDRHRATEVVAHEENCATAFIGRAACNGCPAKRKVERIAVIVDCAAIASTWRSRFGRVRAAANGPFVAECAIEHGI